VNNEGIGVENKFRLHQNLSDLGFSPVFGIRLNPEYLPFVKFVATKIYGRLPFACQTARRRVEGLDSTLAFTYHAFQEYEQRRNPIGKPAQTLGRLDSKAP